MRRLPDVVAERPRLLLVGINPGMRSGSVGHHFAGNGNPFWRLLHAAGLTPTPLPHTEDPRLGELGIALSNLCARTKRAAAGLRRAGLPRGRGIRAEKGAISRPTRLAVLGGSPPPA